VPSYLPTMAPSSVNVKADLEAPGVPEDTLVQDVILIHQSYNYHIWQFACYPSANIKMGHYCFPKIQGQTISGLCDTLKVSKQGFGSALRNAPIRIILICPFTHSQVVLQQSSDVHMLAKRCVQIQILSVHLINSVPVT